MSEDQVQRTPPWVRKDHQGSERPEASTRVGGTALPPEASPDELEPEETGKRPANAADMSDTVGTGTSIALGCIAGTILLIIFGLIFIGLVALL